jgi:hypothetical protein
MVVTMACQVDNCTVAPNNCYTGYDCCDLTAFGLNTLCVPEGMCVQ